MKKIFSIVITIFVFATTCFAQDYVVEHTEKNMILPDGAIADVLFFKKWADAGKYLKAYTPAKEMRTLIGAGKIVKAKTETELGEFSKTYNAEENESISKICKVMKDTGSAYAFAWVFADKQVRREQFNYKGSKLQYGFLDFFDESHPAYVAFKAGEDAKLEKLNNFIGGIAKSVLSPIGDGAEVASHKNETPEQTLYRLRHKTQEFVHQGSAFGSGTQILKYRYIYRDNGKMINEYIVDLDGNIRSNFASVGTRKTLNVLYPIVEYYSVPEDIRLLAKKSLE